MKASLGPSPGAVRHPHHRVNVLASDKTWSVTLDGRPLATTDKAWIVDESGYESVVYFPPQDVQTDALKISDSRSTCPFKGEAEYFAIDVDGKQRDIAWSYPRVYHEVEAIAGYIAFYADRVHISSGAIDEE